MKGSVDRTPWAGRFLLACGWWWRGGTDPWDPGFWVWELGGSWVAVSELTDPCLPEPAEPPPPSPVPALTPWPVLLTDRTLNQRE